MVWLTNPFNRTNTPQRITQHSLCLTTKRKIHSFDSNKYGQLGIRCNVNAVDLLEVTFHVFDPSINPKKILAFNNTSMAMTEENYILIWGETRQANSIKYLLRTNNASFQGAINAYSAKTFIYKPCINARCISQEIFESSYGNFG